MVCMWCSGSVLYVSNMNKSDDIKHVLFAETEVVVCDLFMSPQQFNLPALTPVSCLPTLSALQLFLTCLWFGPWI